MTRSTVLAVASQAGPLKPTIDVLRLLGNGWHSVERAAIKPA